MSGGAVPSGQLSLLLECLDERDLAVLGFAKRHHVHGMVEARVQAELGCSSTRYMQLLNALLDRPEAAEADPGLVGQLRELRDQRAAARRRLR